MIVLSAGHHKGRPGACYEAFCEHDEALRWVHLIRGMLGGDVSVLAPVGVLRHKVEFINVNKPLLAIEIHFNSDTKHSGRGSETLYYPSSVKGKACADIIQSELGRVFEPNRGIKEGYYQLNPERGPDYFLAKTTCTSLIIEPEFIHNKELIINGREVGCQIIASTLLDCVNYLEG